MVREKYQRTWRPGGRIARTASKSLVTRLEQCIVLCMSIQCTISLFVAHLRMIKDEVAEDQQVERALFEQFCGVGAPYKAL